MPVLFGNYPTWRRATHSVKEDDRPVLSVGSKLKGRREEGDLTRRYLREYKHPLNAGTMTFAKLLSAPTWTARVVVAGSEDDLQHQYALQLL